MRAIDADTLIEKCGNWYCEEGTEEGFIGDIKHLMDAQPTIEPEQRWIPCSERMPEEDNCTGSGVQYSDDVLITVINTMDEETVIDYGHTTDGEWYSETTDCFIPHGWKPIAWMLLPEPYAERRQDE